jgi:quercetin dioxygenase-like cupin family protein/DNA-binding XRE family transcriptional regulator
VSLGEHTGAAAPPSDGFEHLGRALRDLRHERGLTLVELAARCELSQPFLSQVETGRARPSMESVFRLARALDTTPQALFSGPPADGAGLTLVRHGSTEVPVLGGGGESVARLLLPGEAPFHVIEFTGLPAEFEQPWSHSGFEAVYVVAGEVELDLAGEVQVLAPGDFVSYSSAVPHRHRAVSATTARMLLIEATAEPSHRTSRAHTSSS